MSPLLYGLQDFPDQNFRGGCAGGYADFVFAFEPFALQVAGIVNHIGIDAALGGDFAQAVAVGRVGRADDDDDVAFFRQFFNGGLAVGRGVADVFFVGIADVGETGVQRGDDVFGFIDGQGGLADVGEFVGVFDLQPGDVFNGFDQQHPAGRKLSHGAFDFDVAFVSDHDDFAILRVEAGDFFVDFGHERAGGIKYAEPAFGGFLLYGFGDAVCRVNQDGAFGYVGEVFDEYRAFFAQVVDDEFVVDDFVADVNRCAEFFQRALDDADGAVNAGAEAARVGKDDGFLGHVYGPDFRRPYGLSVVGSSVGLGCFLWNSPSKTNKTAPTQIKLSATLNAG